MESVFCINMDWSHKIQSELESCIQEKGLEITSKFEFSVYSIGEIEAMFFINDVYQLTSKINRHIDTSLSMIWTCKVYENNFKHIFKILSIDYLEGVLKNIKKHGSRMDV